MRIARSALLILGLTLAAVACTASSAPEDRFILTEFSIAGPVSLQSGSISLGADNSGRFAHTLVITDSDDNVVAATDLINPGESVDVDVELSAGQYQFTCRIVTETDDGDIVDHYEAGMRRLVTVSG